MSSSLPPVAVAIAGPEPEAHTIPARDGLPLGALLFLPPNGQGPLAAVQLNPATGAKRRYYEPFAAYLAAQGFAVCLWDYRGAAHSRPVPLAQAPYRFADYGTLDMPAVLDWLEARFPGRPLLVLGHSVGAQQVGLMPNANKLAGLVAVGTGVGYWNYMPLGYRLKTHFFFRIFSPLSHALLGYNAGGRWGIMEDLPRGVVQDWRAWCSVPDYYFDPRFAAQLPPHHYQDLRFPVSVYWATDDPIASARSVPRFWQHVRSAAGIELHRLVPAELGVRGIGHFGFFRRGLRAPLWPRLLADLTQMAEAAAS
ncbi:alpha/beta hydrolase family protein [Hymenobacter terricola]|uniref:alpha/beta hydrolase family protein n=1 Tax=Hymenobacter terricola TaxID=2819236 RepID=UPI001B3088D2|nr:alpha/beta fold hydrolase [Hymenobacter terricola]